MTQDEKDAARRDLATDVAFALRNTAARSVTGTLTNMFGYEVTRTEGDNETILAVTDTTNGDELTITISHPE